MSTTDIPDNILLKLKILQDKLGAEDLNAALDKSLNLANFVADTVGDPSSRLLVERAGKYTELKAIA